jgi:hypothetical protein
VYIFGKVGTSGGPIRTRSKIQVLKHLPDQFEWAIKRIHKPNNNGENKDIIKSNYHFLTLEDNNDPTPPSDPTSSFKMQNELFQSMQPSANQLTNNQTTINQSTNIQSKNNEITTSNSTSSEMTSLPFKRTISEENKPFIRKQSTNQITNDNSISNNESTANRSNPQTRNSTALPDSSTAPSDHSSGHHSANMSENEAEITRDCTNNNVNALAECIPTKVGQSEKGIHSSSIGEISGSNCQKGTRSDQSNI